MIRFILALLIALPLTSVEAETAAVRDALDWPAFMGGHDPVFQQLPRQWNEGAFAGNGNMGFVTYSENNTIVFHLGRMDVTDHRHAPQEKTSLGTRGAGVMFEYPRLDVGKLLLSPVGQITGGTMRMDLWNAEVTGVVTTSLGELRFRAITLRDRMLHILEVASTEKTPEGSFHTPAWAFSPGNSSSPRAITNPETASKAGYEPNPQPSIEDVEGIPVCVTRLLAGGDFATAWLEKNDRSRGHSILFVSTANEIPSSSAHAAVAEVKSAAKQPIEPLLSAHRAWWQQYFRRSFLSIPDPLLESFYWIQIYKLGAVLRADGPALDVLGPFFRTTQWPGIWWNLNIQLSYTPLYASNRLELGETLTRLLAQRFDGIFAGFRNRPNLGDFTWTMHNYWCQLRFAGDWAGLSERWLPKAQQVFASYQTFLKEDSAGRFHLLPMGSPEYHGFATFPNTNYNLALLRWLLNAMVECNQHCRKVPDANAANWQQVLQKLAPYALDENGLRIAENQPLNESHRHYSHLLGLYPLYQLNPDNATERQLMLKSVKHWHALDGGKALTGYSLTGAVSLYASLGMGNEARDQLVGFLTSKTGKSNLAPNTFYSEVGGRNPVIETPLSAASSIMDLVLQSWGGKIRVFPAVPPDWRDASFRDLRAMGGFLVSAVRKNGATQWVSIRSEAGEPCQLKVPDWKGLLNARAARPLEVESLAPGEYRIELQKGEVALLFPQGTSPETVVKALPVAPDKTNLFGVKRGGEIKGNQFWPEPSSNP